MAIAASSVDAVRPVDGTATRCASNCIAARTTGSGIATDFAIAVASEASSGAIEFCFANASGTICARADWGVACACGPGTAAFGVLLVAGRDKSAMVATGRAAPCATSSAFVSGATEVVARAD